MSKLKLRIITLLSFFMLVALCLGVAVGNFGVRKADAATYAPTAIFAAGTGGTVKTLKTSSDGDAYTALVLENDGNVYYRRDLALKWREAKDKDDISQFNERHFTMTFEFGELRFEEFTLAFESAEENVSKEGKTTNSILFTQEEGVLKAAVKSSGNEEAGEAKTVEAGEIKLEIVEDDECKIGEFNVKINGNSIGKFTNVGGYFLEYLSSSSSKPSTPMTFTAKLTEENKDKTQKVLMKELNGQKLIVDEGGETAAEADDGYFEVTGGKITDNESPALVLNEDVYPFTLGQRFSLSYEAIDVCRDSVTVNRYYYMAKQNEEKTDIANPDLKFGSSDFKSLSTSTFFMPSAELENQKDQLVMIRFFLDDGRSFANDSEKPFVYLSWYAVEGAVETKTETKEEEKDGETVVTETKYDYVKVNRDQKGPLYVADDESTPDVNEYENAVDAYRLAVQAAAKDASAGDGAYFYLPSLRGLIQSESADYRNLRFSIYYYKESQTAGATAASATSLRYNALRFEINEAGAYRFRVLATDAAGNAMIYKLDGVDVTVSSTNIWDIEEIPEFTFEVKYTGAVIEDSGEQTNGYRDSAYTVSSFKVIALSGIQKDYNLYWLDESGLTSVPSKSDLTKNAYDYVNGEDSAIKDHLVSINKYNSDIKEGDSDWENSDNAYNWNPSSSLSFVPQKEGFYFVELIVTDPARSSEQTKGYQVIEVRNPYDYTPGQSQWLQNNIVSVVLFSVSAVLLVIIIILFVSKPSEKKVEEIDLEKLKGKKKEKKN